MVSDLVTVYYDLVLIEPFAVCVKLVPKVHSNFLVK